MKQIHSDFLTVAMQAVNAAERITVGYYYRAPRVRAKADKSPVTIADISAEKAMIATIRKHYPDHSFFCEESGHTKTSSEFTWIIDPIDGTRNFVGGIPLWGNLLALMHNDEIILGISNVPLMNERLWAMQGHGAFLNGERVRVSKKKTLREAMISYSSMTSFHKTRREPQLLNLLHATARQRAFGDLWPYHLLASGRLEIVVEGQIKPVDVAPFVCIIHEAGGETSDVLGRSFSLGIRTFIATNGLLHKRAVRYFTRKAT